MCAKSFLLLAYQNLLYAFRYISVMYDRIQYIPDGIIMADMNKEAYVMVRRKWLFWFISKPIKVNLRYIDYLGHDTALTWYAVKTENIPFRNVNLVLPNGRTLTDVNVCYGILELLIMLYTSSYADLSQPVYNTDLTDIELSKLTRVMYHIVEVLISTRRTYDYALDKIPIMQDVMKYHDLTCSILEAHTNNDINTEVEQKYLEKYYISIDKRINAELTITRFNTCGNKVAEYVYPDFIPKAHVDILFILRRLGEYRLKRQHFTCESSDDGCVEFITKRGR